MRKLHAQRVERLGTRSLEHGVAGPDLLHGPRLGWRSPAPGGFADAGGTELAGAAAVGGTSEEDPGDGLEDADVHSAALARTTRTQSRGALEEITEPTA
jgi:hypothetical protein